MFGLQLLNSRPSIKETDEALSRLRRRLPHLLHTATGRTRIDDLPMDSMDVVEVLCAIEDEFGVSLDANVFMRAVTVDDLSAAIAKRLRRNARR
jgi:acyl carrier protein